MEPAHTHSSAPDATPLDAKLTNLRARLRALDGVVIGFSGGVDSGVLVAVAHEVLGGRALAVTTVSETLPAEERAEAGRVARELGLHHAFIEADELARPEFRANDGNRCYFCKDELFDILKAQASAHGFEHIAYGATLDDLDDHRPGMRAASDHGALAPLIDAGLTKSEVRAVGKRLGLSIWDKPSFACLSSRFAYGNVISAEKLSRVERAESLLRRLGFGQFRVRVHDQVARIEVPPEDIERLASTGIRAEIVTLLKDLGFTYVTLDLQGFRSGSMNER